MLMAVPLVRLFESAIHQVSGRELNDVLLAPGVDHEVAQAPAGTNAA